MKNLEGFGKTLGLGYDAAGKIIGKERIRMQKQLIKSKIIQFFHDLAFKVSIGIIPDAVKNLMDQNNCRAKKSQSGDLDQNQTIISPARDRINNFLVYVRFEYIVEQYGNAIAKKNQKKGSFVFLHLGPNIRKDARKRRHKNTLSQ